MAEIRTVTTLRYKRDEIVASIKLYERQLEQARADLAHVMAAIRIFEASGNPKDIPKYIDIHRLFRRGETWALCKAGTGEQWVNDHERTRLRANEGQDPRDGR